MTGRYMLAILFLGLCMPNAVFADPTGDTDMKQLPSGTSVHFKIKSDIDVLPREMYVTLCQVGDLSIKVEVESGDQDRIIRAGREVNLTFTSYALPEGNGFYDMRRYAVKADENNPSQEVVATSDLPNVTTFIFEKEHAYYADASGAVHFTYLTLKDLEQLVQNGCVDGAVKIPPPQEF